MKEVREIGKYIRRARKQKKLSQEKLGELVGISRKRIGELETNKKDPFAQELIALSKKLGKTPDFFLQDFIDPPETPITIVVEWEKLLEDCSTEELRLLLTIIRPAVNFIHSIYEEDPYET